MRTDALPPLPLRPAARWLIAAALLMGLVWTTPPPAVRAAAITVATTADEFNLNGVCSLREAVVAANLNTAVDACPAGQLAITDTITLPAGTFVLSISGSDDDGLVGDLDLIDDVAIVGAGRAATIIEANGLDVIFQVHHSETVATLADLTLSEAAAPAALHLNAGAVTATNVRFTANTNSAIQLDGGALTLRRSRVDLNANGGIVVVSSTADLVVRDSVLALNASLTHGGGLHNFGVAALINSTVSGNVASGDGGGIANSGILELLSTTVADNTADDDGNDLGDGGGVFNAPTGLLVVRNSLLANNADDSPTGNRYRDCAGTLASLDYNLIRTTTGCTVSGNVAHNLYGVNPLLSALQNNGGDTLTQGLLAGSPAINAATPTGCIDQEGDPLTTDQRGYTRPDQCDIGAYEAYSPGVPACPSGCVLLPLIIKP